MPSLILGSCSEEWRWRIGGELRLAADLGRSKRTLATWKHPNCSGVKTKAFLWSIEQLPEFWCLLYSLILKRLSFSAAQTIDYCLWLHLQDPLIKSLRLGILQLSRLRKPRLPPHHRLHAQIFLLNHPSSTTPPIHSYRIIPSATTHLFAKTRQLKNLIPEFGCLNAPFSLQRLQMPHVSRNRNRSSNLQKPQMIQCYGTVDSPRGTGAMSRPWNEPCFARVNS